MDWNEFLEEANSIDEDNYKNTKGSIDNKANLLPSADEVKRQDEVIELDDTTLLSFCSRLSGVSEFLDNSPKASITYQCYNGDEDEARLDDDASIIYELKPNTRAQIMYDALNPSVIKLDLIFPTHDCPEIRLMWARLQKFQESLSDVKVANPIFLINLLENEPLSVHNENEMVENCLEAILINPVIFYLTRQIPTAGAIEVKNANDEIIGGNIIRLIYDTRLVDFKTSDINVADDRAEILREQ